MRSSHDSPQFFRFLRKLRAEGRTNMYGAVPYLMRAFTLDRERAFKVVCDWLDQQSQAATEPVPRKAVRRRAA